MNDTITINLSLYSPEVILQEKDRKVYFNFYGIDTTITNDYLIFFDPITDHISKLLRDEQKPFDIYFDRSLTELEDFDYCREMLGKLKSLDYQELIRFHFKE